MEPILAQARSGKAPAILLFHGEEFLARKAAEEIVDLLVPAGQRDLNLAVLEAAASPGEVARELATVPMFRGTKVVWLRDPEFLAPRKAARGDQLARLRELWEQGRQKEAARRLLALAQKAGIDPATASAAQWKDEAGLDPSGADLEFCRDAANFAATEQIPPPGTDTAELDRLFAAGIPAGNHLVVSASGIDGRLALYKKLKDLGAEVSFKAQGREKRDVGELCREAVEPLGKRIAPAAIARLDTLVGGEQVRLLHAELEKVALYVGERPTIEAADVDAVVEASREVEFLLTNSVEKRDLAGAVEGLSQILDAGGGLPQVVASVATCVRQLLAAQEATRATGGRIPGFGAGASAWVAAFNDAGLKMGNPNAAKFKAEAAARFGRDELLWALIAAADADLEVKSGGGRLVVERLLWDLCK
ncbi:DNA polymerase III delta subunit [Vulgatibacter incomptus]|uniref:DNA polymerase III subunit delta n=1 Tax=Vulgatibacter incomptus TaxID=1391653 RepID=A0A0K1PAK5_9BACT|nr:DNA polymerase III delta subunit [Vulgatibacter incomptus]